MHLSLAGCLGIKPDQIEEVYMGCVLQANIGQAPARQVALGAGKYYKKHIDLLTWMNC